MVEFEIETGDVPRLDPDYNIAPTKDVYAVVQRPAKEERPQQRQLRVFRWGLVPHWAKSSQGAARLINARAETVATKASFRSAFARRRAIMPADGYYEWTDEDGVKQPYYIHPGAGQNLAMAGLYEIWCDQTRDAEDPARFLWSCAVITTQSTDAMGRLHDRMPMTIARENYDDWLDPSNDDALAVESLLQPAGSQPLQVDRVSKAVSNVRNNGPDLITPEAAKE